MPAFARHRDAFQDRFGSSMAGAVGLHLAAVAALALAAFAVHSRRPSWGEQAAATGSIQASLVDAIPLPPKAKPVEKAVLASDNETPAPKPPPREAAVTPPKPTDVLIKDKTPAKPVPKVAPIPEPEPPRHPQPIPDTPKATTGDASATQLPQSVQQMRNGTATITVENRTFGNRYAYYLRIVGAKVSNNYYDAEIDPRTSQNRSVTVLFDIERDGSPANVKIDTRSGSASLDTAALRSIQRIDTFGPLPEGDHITIRYKFEYRQP